MNKKNYPMLTNNDTSAIANYERNLLKRGYILLKKSLNHSIYNICTHVAIIDAKKTDTV